MNQTILNNLKLIDSSKKKYEDISVKKDPVFNDVVEAIKLVKNFIRKKGLIIYGGTAIDFALRLKGDAIYTNDSLLFPDLDFFSPDNVNDAYELSLILYQAGWKETRAIVATYVRTMRVDIEKNHFIADITFLHPAVFQNIKTIEFDGMKILPPEFQKIDLHLSLSYPFDKAPREVIFERWKKDIERFNLLDKYYPSKGVVKAAEIQKETIKIPISDWLHTSLFNGFGAYSMICAAYKDLTAAAVAANLNIVTANPKEWAAREENIIHHDFSIKETAAEITFENVKNIPLVFTSYNSEGDAKKIFNEEDAKKMQHFAPLLKLIEENFEGNINSGQKCRVYRSDQTLTGCSIYKVIFNKKTDDYYKIRTVNIQLVLSYFLSMAELCKLQRQDKIFSSENKNFDAEATINLFNAYYSSTKIMLDNAVEIMEEIFLKLCSSGRSNTLIKKFILFNMFFPSIIIAGIKSQSETYFSSLINLDKMKKKKDVDFGRQKVGDKGDEGDKGNEEKRNEKGDDKKITYDLPVNFYPGRFIERFFPDVKIEEGEDKNNEKDNEKDKEDNLSLSTSAAFLSKFPKFDYSKSKFFIKNGEVLS